MLHGHAKADARNLGSQSILGAIPDPPDELTVSVEADVAPKNKPALEAVIEGAIGELSPFHATFGYYADGVDVLLLPLPSGWERRVVVIQNQNTRFARGLCLEPQDCAASKLIAGRQKDLAFVAAWLRHQLIRKEVQARPPGDRGQIARAHGTILEGELILGGSSGLSGFATAAPAFTEDLDFLIREDLVVAESARRASVTRPAARGWRQVSRRRIAIT